MTTVIILVISLAVLAFGIAAIFRRYHSAKVAEEESEQVEDKEEGKTNRVVARQQGRTDRLKARLGRWFKR